MSSRPLSVTLVPHPMGRYGTVTPAIFVDGVQQEFAWGTGVWQVAADRPVTVAVMFWDELGTRRGFAEYTVQPGELPDLEYRAPSFVTAPGALGPRGTVSHQGNNSYAIQIAIGIGFVVVALVVTAIIVAEIMSN